MKSVLLIAAAGMGTRMKTETPKCLFEFDDTPNILIWLKRIPKKQFHIVVVVGYQSELVSSVVTSFGNDVHLVRNEHFAQSSALDSYKLGLRDLVNQFDSNNRLELLSKPGLIICGDLVMRDEDAIRLFREQKLEFCGVSRVRTDGATSVELSGDSSQVIRIYENQKDDIDYYWGNYGNFTISKILNQKGKFLRDVARSSLPCRALITSSTDYDTPSDLEIARELFRSSNKHDC